MQSSVRILVVGDKSVGKTSLITTLVSDDFQEKVPPTIPPVVIPSRGNLSVRREIIDSSSRPGDEKKVDDEIKRAGFICVVYDVTEPNTLARVQSHWIPRIRALRANEVPLALIATKKDLLDPAAPRTEEAVNEEIEPILAACPNIEYVAEVSVKDRELRGLIEEVFSRAELCVLYPRLPICDENDNFTAKFTRVLRRIFDLLDVNRDGFLSDADVISLDANLSAVYDDIKAELEEQGSGFIDRINGMPFMGFVCMFHLLNQRSSDIFFEWVWTILRKYRYDNELNLAASFACPELPPLEEGERYELSANGKRLVANIVRNIHQETSLSSAALYRIFEFSMPEGNAEPYPTPWKELGFPLCCVTLSDAADGDNEKDEDVLDVSTPRSKPQQLDFPPLPHKSWAAMWDAMTFFSPQESLLYLAYLRADPAQPLTQYIEKKKRGDRKGQPTVFLGYVFGPPKSGKTALLNAFVSTAADPEAALSLERDHTTSVFAINTMSGQNTLILEEPPRSKQLDLIRDAEKMKMCDVAVFAFDRSDARSFEEARKLYDTFYAQEGNRRTNVIFIGTKGDLNAFPRADDVVAAFCRRSSLQQPRRVSVKEGEGLGALWPAIVQTASTERRLSTILTRLLPAFRFVTLTSSTLAFVYLFATIALKYWKDGGKAIAQLTLADFRPSSLIAAAHSLRLHSH